MEVTPWVLRSADPLPGNWKIYNWQFYDIINNALWSDKLEVSRWLKKFNFYSRAAAGSYLENDNKLHTRAEKKIIFRY